MLPKRWLIKPQAYPEDLARYPDMSPVLAQVLYNRDLTNPQDAARFLQALLEPRDPFKLKGMNKAVARIRQAIKQREPIVVYGDFDADGVTATALLVQTFKALGAVVKPYIPHRVDEGYGLNSEALLRIARAGVKLVVTVDCGIRSVQDVEDGKATGLDIIVTDHHSIGPEIPDAYAVINPKQEDCKYPEDMLAGVGIAYKVAEALLIAATGMRDRNQPTITLDDLIDLVAIGTVADLAPLNRLENRALVRRGLDALNAPKRLGVRALIQAAGLKVGSIGAVNIGFALAPRINAAGRLESAMLAYDLLMSTDESEAAHLAQELQTINTRRQDLTRTAQDIIRQRLEVTYTGDAPLIFEGDRSFQPGIVGLVAGRLVEEYFRPVVILEEGDIESRASCRSIPQFDITHALDQCADLLVRHGGHAQAAGFTVLNGNIPALKDRLTGIAQDALDGQELLPTLDIDAELDPAWLTLDLARELACLEPTGHANEQPIFVTRGLRVQEARTVGKDEAHLKLKLLRPGETPIDAIGFNLSEWAHKMPGVVDVAYRLEINEYNGARTAQLNLQDIRQSER